MKRSLSSTLSILSVISWLCIAYNVGIELWAINKLYSVLGTLACLTCTLQVVAFWVRELASNTYFWSWR